MNTKNRRHFFALIGILGFLFAAVSGYGQTSTVTSGNLSIEIKISEPCGGSNNGFIQFKVLSSTGQAKLQVIGPTGATSLFIQTDFPASGIYIHNPAQTLIAGNYNYLIVDDVDVVSTTSFGGTFPTITLTALPTMTITDDPGNDLSNSSCTTPDGKVGFSLSGGSQTLGSGLGSYKYTISRTPNTSGFPLTGTYDGTTTLDIKTLYNVANPGSPITGLSAGVYTVVITDNFSVCTATTQWTVTDPSPNTSFVVSTTTPSICLGSSGTIKLSNSEGSNVTYQIFKNGVSDSNVPSQTGTSGALTFTIPAPPTDLTPAATYTFTIQAVNGSCTPAFMTTSANIVVNSLPTTSSITGTASVCASTTGVSYSVTNTVGSTYAWTITGGTQASGGTSSSITVDWGSTAGAGNVAVIETNSAGCPGTQVNLPVTIKAIPATSAITGSNSVCANTNGVSYSVTNTAGSTYAWTITGGTQASGTNTHAITVNWGAAGAGDVQVVETNSGGCAGSPVDLPVTINAKPTTSAITGNASVCANSTGVAYSVTNTAGSTYVWTITGGTQASGGTTSSITVDWGAGPTGNVKVVETNSAGCAGAAKNKSITINAAPVTSAITGNTTVCANTNGVSYSVTNTAGSTYAWIITGGTQASGTNTNSITVNWGAGPVGNVQVVETNSAGCAGTAVNLAVTINSPSTSAITGNASVCANTNGVSYSVTNTAGSTYAWTITGGVQATGTNTNSITVNWGAAGAGNVKVVETSSAGCIGTAVNLPVTINAAPVTSSITGNASVCANTNGVSYSVTNTAGSTYAWTITGGTQAGGTNTNSITVNWGTGPTGNVQVIETSSANCAGAAVNLSVVITTAPSTSVAGSDQAICLATSATLAANSPTVGTGAWSVFSGPSTSASQFSSTTNPTATFTPSGGAGSYVLTWAISNAPCTPSTSNVTITVTTPLTPSVTIGASPSSTICAGTNVTFTATPTNGGVPSYQWKKNGINVGTNSSTFSDNTLANGDQITVVMISSLSCVTSSTATSGTTTMTVNPKPVTSAITGTTPICENTSTTYSVTNTAGSTYNWTITGGAQTGGNTNHNITVTWGSAGPGNVQVIETNGAGCAGNPVNLAITINGAPSSSVAGSNQTICASGFATLGANAPTTGTGAWSVSSGPSTSASQFSSTSNPTATFTPAGGTGDYVLIWTISNAPCAASTSNVTIHVDAVPTTANAGPDQGVCGTSTTLAANTPSIGTGNWSIITGSGGTIATTTSPTSAFSGTVGTTYILQWAVSNGTCPPSTDNVNIIFSTPPTTANAGPDQALCGTSTSLAGNTPASGSGTWSIVSGVGGSITTPANPSSTFSGTAGTAYTLRWTITNGACTPSTDDVSITFDKAPTTAAAGVDQSVCGTSATLAGNTPIVGTGLWSIVSGAGGSITTATSPTSGFTGTIGNSYTLRWTISNGSCTPSTDDVNISFIIAPSPADAGPDQDLCNVTSTTLAGVTPTSGTGIWTLVSGTASITTPTSPTSGVTGLVTGTATLRWTVTNGSCPASTDDVNITVNAAPSTAAAGSDQTVCGPATLAANTPLVGTGAWSVVTGAGGSFSNASSPTSTFSGVGGATYTLQWTITSGTCIASSDNVDITFDINSPTPANAGSDQNNCGTTVTLNGNAPTVGTGGWSIVSGTGGSFVDSTNPTTDFSGVQGNTYTLRWTITSGACTPSTDDVIITFDLNPSNSVAGSDQTLCGTSATLAANTPTTGTGLWSIVSGSGGSFVDATNPGTVFNGTQGTAYVLQWTISNGSCTANTDNVTITFEQAPTTAAAGADNSSCGTSITLAANTPTTGTGLWSIVSGAGGSFIDATDPATTFNGTQGEVYVLRWTISNATCTPSIDDVQITLDQTPTTANAGPDQTPCGPTTLAANAPTVGTGTWSILSGVGGSFSDATSPTSTFSGTAGVTYALRWTISNGSCTPSTDDVQIQFDANSPTTANAGPDQDICGASTPLAANTPLIGTGTWSIVSGNGGSFVDATNPTTTFSGSAGTTYTLRWTISSVGGCAPSTDDVQIIFDQTPSTAFAGTDQSGCNTNITLAGNTPAFGTGTWTIVSGLGGSITNPNSPNSGFIGSYGNTYTLRWTISSGSCTSSSDDVVININPAGSCVVTGNCATVVITPKTTPATCTNYDGQIVFSIKPFVPTVNNIGVNISFTGTAFDGNTYSDSHRNDSTFVGVPSGTFDYTIVYGDSACIIKGKVTVDHSGTVGTPVASNPVDATCFGTPSGAVTIDVPGETGNLLEWSLDGILWTQFTAGNQITGIPAGPAPTFQRVISVRKNSSDPCYSSVTVTINNANSDIQVNSSTTDATCANNDGQFNVVSISGGAPGPYTYQWDGNGTSNLSFTGQAGGSHIFTVVDVNNCAKNFPININFPGFVDFTTQNVSPDCSGTGSNGSIVVTVLSSGTFDVGVTTDPNVDPTAVQSVTSTGNANVIIGGLSQGIYYVVAKPSGALCKTVSPRDTLKGGPFAVDFNLTADNFVCYESKGSVKVYSIKGSLSVNYSYEIINSGTVIQSGSITQLQALDTVNLVGLDNGSYQIHLFQDQSASTGCVNPIASNFKDFNINGPLAILDTLYVVRKFSQTNLPTGSMLIGISESQEPTYHIMLKLLEPKRAGQRNDNLFDSTWVEATRNNADNNIEFNATGLYAGDYRLYIRDTLGCTKTYDLNIDYDRELFIPNIFTPNNDNKNDSFEIINLPDKSSIIISNRWGKEVYKSSNLKVGPDGITTIVWNGGSESDGIYYYTLNTPSKTYTGWVEILHPND